MKKLGLLSIFVLLSNNSYAGFAVSATGGFSDYTLSIDEGGYEEEVDGNFFHRDLSLDYSMGSHQFGIKLGGLAKKSGVISATEDFPQYDEVFTDTGDLGRDEWSLFYTYRVNGWAFTTGYYSSEANLDRVYSWDGSNFNGTGQDYNFTQAADKKIDNEGIFAGVAYGYSITDKLGVFGRLGYQISEMEENIALSRLYTAEEIGTLFEDSAERFLSADGSAIVYGIGAYYVLDQNWSATLFLDSKKFSYDDTEYTTIVNGEVFVDDFSTEIDEEQTTLGITLRYSF